MKTSKNILGLVPEFRSIPFTLFVTVSVIILLVNILVCVTGEYRDYRTALVFSGGIILLFVALLLFRKRYIYMATLLLVVIYNALIFWVVFNLGRISGAMLYYFPLIVGFLFIFLYNSTFARSVSLVSVLLLFLLGNLIFTEHKSTYFFLPDPELEKIYIINLILSILGTIAVVISLYRHFMHMHRRVVQMTEEVHRELLRDLDLQREKDGYALLLSIRDDISQTLASSRMYLQMNPEQAEYTRIADEHVKTALAGLNEISLQLSPSMLVDMGLKEGLETYAAMLAEQYALPVKIELMPGSGELAEPERISLYRILQQCITIISRLPEPGYLNIRISHRFSKLTINCEHGAANHDLQTLFKSSSNRDLAKRLLYYNARMTEEKGRIRIEMDMPD